MLLHKLNPVAKPKYDQLKNPDWILGSDHEIKAWRGRIFHAYSAHRNHTHQEDCRLR